MEHVSRKEGGGYGACKWERGRSLWSMSVGKKRGYGACQWERGRVLWSILMGKREGVMEHVSGKEGGCYGACKWKRGME